MPKWTTGYDNCHHSSKKQGSASRELILAGGEVGRGIDGTFFGTAEVGVDEVLGSDEGGRTLGGGEVTGGESVG